jgi:hypothetical protein
MKMRFFSFTLPSLPANAMALYPIMLFKSKRLKSDQRIINHEKIHFRQQHELLILPFYILYLSQYLINRLKYKDHDLAYRNISFEKEAYSNDHDLTYLKNRKAYAWVRYMR